MNNIKPQMEKQANWRGTGRFEWIFADYCHTENHLSDGGNGGGGIPLHLSPQWKTVPIKDAQHLPITLIYNYKIYPSQSLPYASLTLLSG